MQNEVHLFPRWCSVIGLPKSVTYFAKLQNKKFKKQSTQTLYISRRVRVTLCNHFQTNQIKAALCNEQINSGMGLVQHKTGLVTSCPTGYCKCTTKFTRVIGCCSCSNQLIIPKSDSVHKL